MVVNQIGDVKEGIFILYDKMEFPLIELPTVSKLLISAERPRLCFRAICSFRLVSFQITQLND